MEADRGKGFGSAATALALGGVLAGVFDVPVRGSLLIFFAATTLYVVALSGLGLYIATLTRNMAQASMLSILVLAPMIFLSGAWTPPEAMPTVARWLMVISPLYYYIDVAYGVILKGAGLDVLGPSFAGIVVLGTIARPEGDYLVAQTLNGYILLALAVTVFVSGFLTSMPRRRPPVICFSCATASSRLSR